MRLPTYQGKVHGVTIDRLGLAAGVYAVGLFQVAASCTAIFLVNVRSPIRRFYNAVAEQFMVWMASESPVASQTALMQVSRGVLPGIQGVYWSG